VPPASSLLPFLFLVHGGPPAVSGSPGLRGYQSCTPLFLDLIRAVHFLFLGVASVRGCRFPTRLSDIVQIPLERVISSRLPSFLPNTDAHQTRLVCSFTSSIY